MTKKLNNEERIISGVKVVNNRKIKNMEESIERIENRETGAVLSNLSKTFRVRWRSIYIMDKRFNFENIESVIPSLVKRDVTFRDVFFVVCKYFQVRFKIGKYEMYRIDIDKQFRDYELNLNGKIRDDLNNIKPKGRI